VCLASHHSHNLVPDRTRQGLGLQWNRRGTHHLRTPSLLRLPIILRTPAYTLRGHSRGSNVAVEHINLSYAACHLPPKYSLGDATLSMHARNVYATHLCSSLLLTLRLVFFPHKTGRTHELIGFLKGTPHTRCLSLMPVFDFAHAST
jgi:hypothetical protein